MVLTRAQKQDAYREARDIMKLSEKWQELMPGEKRPNFERAAQEVIRRAIGHKIERNEQPLDVHGGYMHQHAPREARLIERYLRSGTVIPGRPRRAARRPGAQEQRRAGHYSAQRVRGRALKKKYCFS